MRDNGKVKAPVSRIEKILKPAPSKPKVEIEYGPPLDNDASPLPVIPDPDDMPEHVFDSPIIAAKHKVATAYIPIDVRGPPKRNKEAGEYVHPVYAFGRKFTHSAEPHIGPVSYITTFAPNGPPLVQPLDEKGENKGTAFQAKPENLTEP